MNGCTKNHKQLKTDVTLWNKLVIVGIQVVEADETGPAERYELRDCPCGSTLSRLVTE